MLQEMDPYVGLLISIHAPRAGSDKCSFGLTPSEFNFNPRSPCGERPNDGKIGTLANNFNPRSPCGERRFNASFMIFTARLFQSTLPVRGATRRPRLTYTLNPRSPCGERHAARDGPICRPADFNPRSPCGERQVLVRPHTVRVQFQSTLPVRGATQRRQDRHAGEQFQSTLPVRGATFQRVFHDFHGAVISIHAPRAGSDAQTTIDIYTHLNISIHAPRAGSDDGYNAGDGSGSDFNPRSPCGERQ